MTLQHKRLSDHKLGSNNSQSPKHGQTLSADGGEYEKQERRKLFGAGGTAFGTLNLNYDADGVQRLGTFTPQDGDITSGRVRAAQGKLYQHPLNQKPTSFMMMAKQSKNRPSSGQVKMKSRKPRLTSDTNEIRPISS